jgi:HEAT repeat protein
MTIIEHILPRLNLPKGMRESRQPRKELRMRSFISKERLTVKVVTRNVLILLFNALTVPCCAQIAASQGWPVLETALAQKATGQRVAAVRVLGLISDDSHAAELAGKALKDPRSDVRAAAATALGQMHATGVDASLKQALNDKSLSVVMASAHALRLLNDPACYDAYYEIFTGEKKNDAGMISQEMKVFHDPRQVVKMGFNEGVGYIPFAGIPWEALQTIMKDRKDGAAAKAALITALATDPEPRTGKLLLNASKNPNWILRVAALEAIAKRGDASLMPEIEPRISDSKREVRFTAAATVIHLEDIAKSQPSGDTKIARATMPANGEPKAVSAVMQAAK